MRKGLKLHDVELKVSILRFQKLLQNIEQDIGEYRLSKPLKPVYGRLENLLAGLNENLRSNLDIELLNNGSFVVKKKKYFIKDNFTSINNYLQNLGYNWIEIEDCWKKQK